MEQCFEAFLFGLITWLCAVILLGILSGGIDSRPTRVLNSSHSYETAAPGYYSEAGYYNNVTLRH